MTTTVTVKNENNPNMWDVEIVGPDGVVLHYLKPGESAREYLFHDGRALMVREVPKAVQT